MRNIRDNKAPVNLNKSWFLVFTPLFLTDTHLCLYTHISFLVTVLLYKDSEIQEETLVKSSKEGHSKPWEPTDEAGILLVAIRN